MTDNEKRAHDLTLLYIKENQRLKIAGAASTAKAGQTTVIPVNYLDDYLKMYPEVLAKINEYFSEQSH